MWYHGGMEASTADRPSDPPLPPARPRFRPLALAGWLPFSAGTGVLVAWLAVLAGSYFHPLAIFELAVGFVLGAVLVLLMRIAQAAHRPTLVAGTVLAAAICVAGQHYFSYLRAWQKYEQAVAESQNAALMEQAAAAFGQTLTDRLPKPPGTITQYMARQAEQGRPIGRWHARGWLAWLSWALGGLLELGAALALVVPSMRLPYCDRCRSWYRTVRAGKLAPAPASRLARIGGLELPGDAQAARFRLQSCTGGCGPTSLELFWEQPGSGPATARAWLDAARRDEVARSLDRPSDPSDTAGAA